MGLRCVVSRLSNWIGALIKDLRVRYAELNLLYLCIYWKTYSRNWKEGKLYYKHGEWYPHKHMPCYTYTKVRALCPRHCVALLSSARLNEFYVGSYTEKNFYRILRFLECLLIFWDSYTQFIPINFLIKFYLNGQALTSTALQFDPGEPEDA